MPAVTGLQARLMRDHLKDSRDLGSVRRRVDEIMPFAVFHGKTLVDTFVNVTVAPADLEALCVIANTALDHLEQHNRTRHNLARGMTHK